MKISLAEIRKRNMIIACFKTPDSKATLKVKVDKDNKCKADYIVSISGKNRLIHRSDIDILKLNCDLKLEQIEANNKFLIGYFKGEVNYA